MSASEEHQPMYQPVEPTATIWRHMDFTKFVSMLESRTLYFSRVDLLGDPYEGSTPRGNKHFWEVVHNKYPDTKDAAILSEKRIRGFVEHSRHCAFVNCWHINNHESTAMWDLYSKEQASIAIQSEYSFLRSSLPDRVGITTVKYIDYESDSIPPFHMLDYYLHKRIAYAHEKELRALIWALEFDSKTNSPCWDVEPDSPGIEVHISLEHLVRSVYVAPRSPVWFEQLVRKLLERYELDIPVRRSQIEKEPLY